MTKSFQVYMFNLGVSIAELLPRSITILIAKILALLGFLVAKNSRQIVRKNLMYCNQTEFSYNTFRTISNYAVCLFDKLRIPIFDYEVLKKMVDVSGTSNFDKALSFNRGAILITAHLGNWDLAGVYVSYLGYPLTAVVEEIPGLSDFYNFLRTRTGMETVFMRERDKMTEALTKNRILVLLGDRDLTGRGIPVKFLSGEKKLPRGPAAFALKYDVPILFAYFVLNNDKKKPYKIEISGLIFPENQTQEELTQLIADRLSDCVSKFPLQWFVFKDEWLN